MNTSNMRPVKNQSWRKQKKSYNISRKKRPVKRKTSQRTTYKKRPVKRKEGGIKGLIKNLFKNKKFLKFLFFFIFIFILFLFISFARLSASLPEPDQLMEREVAQSTIIYDRTGENILYEVHGNEQRTLVNLDEIPDHIKWATIAIEDKNFYEHKGISLWGIFRGVVWQTIRGKRAQGGSTLTQQLAKNAVLTSERTITRKVKEWILAYRIEQKYEKDEILQMYLNEIPYGSVAYGVEAASQRYFGKSVKEINVAEAAILAALPQAPSKYSPYGSNLDLLIGRQHYILNLMYDQGYISEAKKEAAKLYELEFKAPSEDIEAPHFIMYVKELLSEKYGEKMVEQGGLKIYTTLDLYKQKIAEEVVKKYAEQNEEKYNASNAALVSLDPKNGQILSMVGSKDFFNQDIDGQVNVAISSRQPGSSIKPLIYASLFDKGYTTKTILYDVLTNFSNNEDKPYEPHNYDLKEHGPVTIRKALAGSLNIPAVKAIYLAGIDNVLDFADELGYSTLKDRDRFGLSLVLGGGEVKLLEHTNAFSAFAREGKINEPSVILKVVDRNGEILEEWEEDQEEVLKPEVARAINSILSDNEARAYAFGTENWLTLGDRPVAAKTGTTNDYKDAWTIGYTPSLVSGVWVGNNNNSEMNRGASGGTVAAPIWHDFMKQVLGDTPIEDFKDLEEEETGKPVLDGEIGGGNKVKIDKISGLLATEHTPEHLIEEKNFSEDHCILYYVDKDDPLDEAPKNPEKDPQFELWESRVLKWAEEQGRTSESPPKEHDNIHLPENLPKIQILSPTKNQTINNSYLTAQIKASAPRGIDRVEYYIDGNMINSTKQYPFNLDQNIEFLNNGFHNLKAKACDDADNCSEKTVEFNLMQENEPSKEKLNISIVSPGSGLAVNTSDFPISIITSISNSWQAAKINFYEQKKDSSPILIKSIHPIENNQKSFYWEKPQETGEYKIFAEVIGWLGQKEKSNEITINISDPEKEENSTE